MHGPDALDLITARSIKNLDKENEGLGNLYWTYSVGDYFL